MTDGWERYMEYRLAVALVFGLDERKLLTRGEIKELLQVLQKYYQPPIEGQDPLSTRTKRKPK